ncbi:hypothetical protein [Streptomyces sp. LN785]
MSDLYDYSGEPETDPDAVGAADEATRSSDDPDAYGDYLDSEQYD